MDSSSTGVAAPAGGGVFLQFQLESSSCNKRGCKVQNEPILNCAGQCGKSFHLSCFRGLHGSKEWFGNVQAGVVLCTKKCYENDKKLSMAQRKPGWQTDGAEGVEDPKCSERILLDWLLTPGNYSNLWRGKDNKGANKKQVAGAIADLINKSGVVVERDAKQVMNKIQHIERQFREAYDFSNTETGQGLQEGDTDGFDEAVTKRCRYYFDLYDIFADRASTQPKILSTDILDSSSESSSEPSNEFTINDSDEGNNDQRTGIPSAINVVDLNFQETPPVPAPGASLNSSTKKRPGTASSSKKPKKASDKRPKTPVFRLFDDETNDTLIKVGTAKEKVAEATMRKMAREENEYYEKKQMEQAINTATLRKLEREEELQKMDAEKQRIEQKMFKMGRLVEVRERFPTMMDTEILKLFPEFEDIIEQVKR